MTAKQAIEFFENYDYSNVSKSNLSKVRNTHENLIFLLSQITKDINPRTTENGVLNAGDIGELAIKWAMRKETVISPCGQADVEKYRTVYEVKTAIGNASRSTELKDNGSKYVIVLNGTGIWKMPMNIALQNTLKGKFTFVQSFDDKYRYSKLESILNFDNLPHKPTAKNNSNNK